MRPIVKEDEPGVLRSWKTGDSADWLPSYAALGGSVKDALLSALLHEQGFVCCYCERRVAAGESCHIEHLVARSEAPDRELDYSNLLCSCTATRSAHCGMKKGSRPIEVHPLQPDCTSAFRFLADGSIECREGNREGAATGTILTLGLNAPSLRDQRRRAVFHFLEVTQHLPPQQVVLQAVALLERDCEGRCVPWATAVKSIVAP